MSVLSASQKRNSDSNLSLQVGKISNVSGGAEEGRTPDLRIANAALCQTELLPHMWWVG